MSDDAFDWELQPKKVVLVRWDLVDESILVNTTDLETAMDRATEYWNKNYLTGPKRADLIFELQILI